MGDQQTSRPIVPVLLKSGLSYVPTYALLDSGATCCAIAEDLAISIKAKFETLTIKLGTFEQETISNRPVASFDVSDLNQSFSISIKKAIVVNKIVAGGERPPTNELVQKYAHMDGINFPKLPHNEIGIIISTQFAHTWITSDVVFGEEDEPIVLFTKFGPTIIGPTKEVDDESDYYESLHLLDMEEASLRDAIRRMFRNDFLMRSDENYPSEVTHMSRNDEISLSFMQKTITFNKETGHYQVPLPFLYGRSKTEETYSKLDTYTQAMSRHNNMRKQFTSKPWLRKGSFAQVSELLDKNYATVVDAKELLKPFTGCFLPNLIVLHPDKPGKFRLCQDGRAKVSGDVGTDRKWHSLNDYLHKGPDLLNNLVGHLVRFRENRYVLVGDVKDFFYRVEVHPNDTKFLRFLWWSDETMSEVITLEGRVHIFGLASSPAVSTFVVRHHADMIKADIPDSVYYAMKKSMYVDDYMDSIKTIDEAIMIKDSLTKIFSDIGMLMTKWQSNSIDIVPPTDQTLPSVPLQANEPTGDTPMEVPETPTEEEAQDQSSEAITSPSYDSLFEVTEKDEMLDMFDEFESDRLTVNEVIERSFREDCKSHISSFDAKDQIGKILGVGFDFLSDEICVRIKELLLKKEVKTMVQLLSFVASIFDPMGLASPVTVKGRMLLQKCNELKLGWKDPLPDEILAPFEKWRSSLHLLNNLRIPRWTSGLGFEDAETELLCCSDAGREGYGIVFYIRKSLKGGGDQPAHVTLLLSKSHVVPINMLKNPVENQEIHGDSIPRLELVAAKLSAVWRDIVVRESREIFANVYMFCDSVTTLRWIGDTDRRFKTFENFKLKFIRHVTDISEWYYIPSDENPADVCSKGANADERKKLELFLKGPAFFRKPKSEWPPQLPHSLKPKEQLEEIQIAAAYCKVVPPVEPHEVSCPEFDVKVWHLQAVLATAKSVETRFSRKDDKPWPLVLASTRFPWISKVRRIAAVSARLRRFIEFVRAKRASGDGAKIKFPDKAHITRDEYNKAELMLIRSVQNEHYFLIIS